MHVCMKSCKRASCLAILSTLKVVRVVVCTSRCLTQYLVCAAAAGVCQWATHLHLQLAPFVKEVDVPAVPDNDADYAAEEYADFDNSKVLPWHKATAMSALSAIALLPSLHGPDEADQQALLEAMRCWTFPVQLHQQSQTSWRGAFAPGPEACQQVQPKTGGQSDVCLLSDGQSQSVHMSDGQSEAASMSDGQSEAAPMSDGQLEACPMSDGQSEADSAPGTPQLACATLHPAAESPCSSEKQSGVHMPSPAGTGTQDDSRPPHPPLPSGSHLLQINVREVLGFGSTGTVFAGRFHAPTGTHEPFYTVILCQHLASIACFD